MRHVLRARHVSKEPAGSTQSKQWRIELYCSSTVSGCLNWLFCWSWLACTDRATLSAIVYFEWSPPVPLKNDARATPGKVLYILENVIYKLENIY